MRMLSRETALELVEASANSKGLAMVVLLCFSEEEDGAISLFIVGHMMYSRAGGFLLVLPSADEVRAALVGLEPTDGAEGPAVHECEVDMETPRGRQLGTSQALLVDIPSELISGFCSSATARGRGLSAQNTLQFMVEGAMARPIKASVIAAADA